jgi:hypothetical protein
MRALTATAATVTHEAKENSTRLTKVTVGGLSSSTQTVVRSSTESAANQVKTLEVHGAPGLDFSEMARAVKALQAHIRLLSATEDWKRIPADEHQHIKLRSEAD